MRTHPDQSIRYDREVIADADTVSSFDFVASATFSKLYRWLGGATRAQVIVRHAILRFEGRRCSRIREVHFILDASIMMTRGAFVIPSIHSVLALMTHVLWIQFFAISNPIIVEGTSQASLRQSLDALEEADAGEIACD